MGRSDRNSIGSDAEKAGVAQADLSGKTHQQIHTQARQREDKDERANPVIVG